MTKAPPPDLPSVSTDISDVVFKGPGRDGGADFSRKSWEGPQGASVIKHRQRQ
jgi:hypothetical protein